MQLNATLLDASECRGREDTPGPSWCPVTHTVWLDEAIGSGTSAVVFGVRSVEQRETSTQRTTPRTNLVAKVSKKGADESDPHGARAEARILAKLKPHQNVVGFHGLFQSMEGSEELESVLGTFAKRTFSKKLLFHSRSPAVSLSSPAHSSSATPTAAPASPLPDSSATLRLRTQSDDVDATQQGRADLPRLHLFTLQEWCDRSLKDFLNKHSPTEPQLAFIMSNILQGLAHIHEHHVFHRDLTDGNILLADGGRRVVLGDFDLSVETKGASEVTWRCGTPGFVAPEVLTKRRGTERSDIFSAGIVAFFAACGQHAFMRESYKATAHATIHEEADFWGGQVLQRSSACLSLIDAMLCKQGFLRPSAREALMSKWLEETPKQDVSKPIYRKTSWDSVVSGDVTKALGNATPEPAKPKSKSYWKKLAAVPSVFGISRLFARKGRKRLSEHRLAQVVPS